jgi:hypothetical protein
MKLVDKSTTALMKNNSEAALNNFRDLMKVGHTPTPTPRGSRFMVIDYERPRTHENNMLIDLLAPDSHQNWRGTLRCLLSVCALYCFDVHHLELNQKRYVCACVYELACPHKGTIMSKCGKKSTMRWNGGIRQ